MGHYLTDYEVALRLAVLLERSKQTRARISGKTLRMLAGRDRLRLTFVTRVMVVLLEEFQWVLVELDTGAFGAVKAPVLEAARFVTIKRMFTVEERREIRRHKLDFGRLWDAIAPEEPSEPSDDE